LAGETIEILLPGRREIAVQVVAERHVRRARAEASAAGAARAAAARRRRDARARRGAPTGAAAAGRRGVGATTGRETERGDRSGNQASKHANLPVASQRTTAPVAAGRDS